MRPLPSRLPTLGAADRGYATIHEVPATYVWSRDLLVKVLDPETTHWNYEPQYVSFGELWRNTIIVQNPIHWRTLRRLLKPYMTDDWKPLPEVLERGDAKIKEARTLVFWTEDGLQRLFDEFNSQKLAARQKAEKTINLKGMSLRDRLAAKKEKAVL